MKTLLWGILLGFFLVIGAEGSSYSGSKDGEPLDGTRRALRAVTTTELPSTAQIDRIMAAWTPASVGGSAGGSGSGSYRTDDGGGSSSREGGNAVVGSGAGEASGLLTTGKAPSSKLLNKFLAPEEGDEGLLMDLAGYMKLVQGTPAQKAQARQMHVARLSMSIGAEPTEESAERLVYLIASGSLTKAKELQQKDTGGSIQQEAEELCCNKFLPHALRILGQLGDATPSEFFLNEPSTNVIVNLADMMTNAEIYERLLRLPPINQKGISDLLDNCLPDELVVLLKYNNPSAMFVIALRHYKSNILTNFAILEEMDDLIKWIQEGDAEEALKRRLASHAYYWAARGYHTGREEFSTDNTCAYSCHLQGIEIGGEDAFVDHFYRLARHQLNGWGWGCDQDKGLAQRTYKAYREKCADRGEKPKKIESMFGGVRRKLSGAKK